MNENIPNYQKEAIAGDLVTKHASVHICTSSIGLDELKPKQARNLKLVLGIIAQHGRFSVFDATENKVIANTMTKLGQGGYYNRTGGSFPWCNIKLTDKGRNLLADERG